MRWLSSLGAIAVALAASTAEAQTKIDFFFPVPVDGKLAKEMTRLVKVASPLGLYAEEFDVATGRHLGNFPQAFSHLALVEAAGTIIVAERVEELGV